MHKIFFMMMEKVGRVTKREGVEAEMRPKPDSFIECGATGAMTQSSHYSCRESIG